MVTAPNIQHIKIYVYLHQYNSQIVHELAPSLGSSYVAISANYIHLHSLFQLVFTGLFKSARLYAEKKD